VVAKVHCGWIDHVTATKSAGYQIVELPHIPRCWGCGTHIRVWYLRFHRFVRDFQVHIAAYSSILTFSSLFFGVLERETKIGVKGRHFHVWHVLNK